MDPIDTIEIALLVAWFVLGAIGAVIAWVWVRRQRKRRSEES